MFKISLENFFKLRFYIYEKLHVQPSELNNMDYYEFHYLVKDLLEHLKEQNEQNKKERDEADSMKSSFKAPNYKAPNISVPKF